MILYTLINSYQKENIFKHDIIGSTFESDTAIYLYFINKDNIEGELYFVFTEIEFNLVKQHRDMNTKLEFFPDIKDDLITNLELYKKNSIYKVQVDYFSDIDFVYQSLSKEKEFTEIIMENEELKKELLPEGYNEQDNKVFIEEEESDILYVAVLNYSLNGEQNTIIAGSSYFSNVCAMLLENKIKEINPDWASFHFKTMLIYKNDIYQFLDNNQIRFSYETENPLLNIMLSPISTDEYNDEFEYLSSDYLDMSEVNEDDFKYFIEHEWKNYNEYFLKEKSKDIVVLEDDNTINIKDIKDNYLIEESEWNDGLELLDYLINNKNISFSLLNNIGYPTVCLIGENKLIAFSYLKDCLTISRETTELKELSFLIFISQKTNFSINNKNKKRLFALTFDKNGIFPLTKDVTKTLYIENHSEHCENLIFTDAKESLNILNLNFKLKDNFQY